MVAGKSFEYALLAQFKEKLECHTNVEVIKNSALDVAKCCFDSVTNTEQSEYLLSASFAVNFLMDIEPRLSNGIDKNDILQLKILTDDAGQDGDVRDVITIRLRQQWEIGVSAKNNHKAVKHSRLSSSIDFGEKWLGFKVSKAYFDDVNPTFENLKQIRTRSNKQAKWSALGNYHASVYVPILNAFASELRRLDKQHPQKVAKNLVAYLVGNKDFYKVIKSKKSVEIHAYNLNGTLSLPFLPCQRLQRLLRTLNLPFQAKNIPPKYKIPKVALPTQIQDIAFKKNTTVIVTLDNDWTLSFRIHNASSRVEPSLKFDITLLKAPKSLFKNTLNIN